MSKTKLPTKNGWDFFSSQWIITFLFLFFLAQVIFLDIFLSTCKRIVYSAIAKKMYYFIGTDFCNFLYNIAAVKYKHDLYWEIN